MSGQAATAHLSAARQTQVHVESELTTSWPHSKTSLADDLRLGQDATGSSNVLDSSSDDNGANYTVRKNMGSGTLHKNNARRFRRDQFPAFIKSTAVADPSKCNNDDPMSPSATTTAFSSKALHLQRLSIPLSGASSQPTLASEPMSPTFLLSADTSSTSASSAGVDDANFDNFTSSTISESDEHYLANSLTVSPLDRYSFGSRKQSATEPHSPAEVSADTVMSGDYDVHRCKLNDSSLETSSAPNIMFPSRNRPRPKDSLGLNYSNGDSLSCDSQPSLVKDAPLSPQDLTDNSSRRQSVMSKKEKYGTMKNTMKRFKGALRNFSSPNLVRSSDASGYSDHDGTEDRSAMPDSRRRSRTGSTSSQMVTDFFNMKYESVEMVVHLEHMEKGILRKAFELPINQTNQWLTCKEAIRQILETVKIDADTAVSYRLFHFDRKYPGIRVLVSPDTLIDNILRDKMEWRLVKHNEFSAITITLPNDQPDYVIQFDENMPVSEAVAILVATLGIQDSKEKYRLFCNSSICYWLDEQRKLYDYDFRTLDKIELRVLTVQLYIRISIPDLVNKFVIKVPPYFTGSEVVSLISYNLKTRNLTLPYEPELYGLWIQEGEMWINNVKTLADYGMHGESTDESGQTIQKQGVIDKGLEYKLHRRHINVVAHYGRFEYDVRCITVATSETTVIGDIMELMQVESPTMWSDKYGMYSRAGELLPVTANVWKTLTEAMSKDEFVYRLANGSIQLRLAEDQDTDVIRIDVNFARPLSSLIGLFCRNLGVHGRHFKMFLLNEIIVDTNKTLAELKISRNDLLVLVLNETTWALETNHQIELSNSKVFDSNISSEYINGLMVNIWEDKDDVPTCIQYESTVTPQDTKTSTRVTAGNLNKLVQKLTISSLSDFTDYTNFVQTFLLTYHSFIDPFTLFSKIKERYCVPRWASENFATYQKERVTVQSRVCNILKTWTKTYPTSFLDAEHGQRLVRELLSFTEEIMAEDRQYAVAKQIRKTLLKLHDGATVAPVNNNIVPAPLPKLPKKISDKPSLFNYDTEEVARQLCLSEHAVYRRIRPTELLGQAWAKKDGQTRAPNVWIMTQRFNNVAAWVSCSVLEQSNMKNRTLRMEWFLDLAWYLLELRNFSVLMAVIAGLNNASIQRLKYTLNDLTPRAKKKLAEIDRVMSMENSFKSYRECLRSTNSELTTQCKIPYLGVHLSDLVYIEDGNPDALNSLINFIKRRLVYDVITEILTPQDHPYNFTLLSEIQCFLRFPPTPQNLEAELYKISLELEPRGWDGKTTPQSKRLSVLS